MSESFARFLEQRGKNLTLLILCGTLIAFFNEEVAGTIFTALCLAVSAPAVAEKWPSASTGETK